MRVLLYRRTRWLKKEKSEGWRPKSYRTTSKQRRRRSLLCPKSAPAWRASWRKRTTPSRARPVTPRCGLFKRRRSCARSGTIIARPWRHQRRRPNSASPMRMRLIGNARRARSRPTWRPSRRSRMKGKRWRPSAPPSGRSAMRCRATLAKRPTRFPDSATASPSPRSRIDHWKRRSRPSRSARLQIRRRVEGASARRARSSMRRPRSYISRKRRPSASPRTRRGSRLK
mmetsp:Transcript_347/g.811  ORF Transcript_347/g.811 Transcript_347/m.811 type:complete len:228 (-) Transcript_347:547-1230(-)